VDLTRKFEEAASNSAVNISTLEMNRKYLIVDAQRVVTKYGHAVLLSIKDKPYNTIKVFLPKRYSAVVFEDDIMSVNTHKVMLHLVYSAKCEKSISYILGIEE